MENRHLRVIALVFVAFVPLGLGACSDPLAPEDVAGDFDLMDVSGSAVPAELAVVEDTIDGVAWSCTYEVVSGSISLAEDRTFSLVVSSGRTCTNDGSSSSSADSNTVTGSFTLDDDVIRLSPGTDFQVFDQTFDLGDGNVTASSVRLPITGEETGIPGVFILAFERTG